MRQGWIETSRHARIPAADVFLQASRLWMLFFISQKIPKLTGNNANQSICSKMGEKRGRNHN